MARKTRREARRRRRMRVRESITGTRERPRLSVFRSSRHMYAQLIDDWAGETLAAASTLDGELQEELGTTGDRDAAAAVGRLVARRALERGIERVVFDRGGYKYHGRVKALADAAREEGLTF